MVICCYWCENLDIVNNYVFGVVIGMYVFIIGVLLFIVFVMFYFIGDDIFMNYIQDIILIGKYFNLFIVSLFVFMEGIVVSLIGFYIVVWIIDMNFE